MLQIDEALETLMNLGLTYLQAKIYLALTQLEKAEVKKISKVSNVARQDIYRIVPTLEKLGLVEKVIGTPILYKAIPLKEGSSMLLQEKTKEHKRLQEKTKLLLNNDKQENIDAMVQEETAQFIVTSEKKLLIKRFEKAFLEARTCELIFPAMGLNFIMFNFFETFKTILAKGVKIRIATEKSETSQSIITKLRTLEKNPLFEFKFATSPIGFGIVIIDSKEVNMCISCAPSEVPSLWTNNPQIVKVAQRTFEDAWNDAQD